VLSAPSDAPAFPALAAFGCIETERTESDGKIKRTAHHVVMSKRMAAWRMMSMARRHWGVENHLHWPLDIVFDEDDARTRKNNAPDNLSVIGRMPLDMSRSHPDPRSIARKMKRAMWSKSFFHDLFIYMR
jgi:predicted transposase YbfD/YdcC